MDKNTSGVTIGDAIGHALKSHMHASAWQWLSSGLEHLAVDLSPGALARVFTSLPRQLESAHTSPTISIGDGLEGPNGLPLMVSGWSMVRLARVWVLTAIPQCSEADYIQLITRLFKYGDMEELVALYSALPVYHYPEAWESRCREGIRSNIGPVRHAVMVDNPYPARFLSEEAWNQLVLKAFFTDENISRIVGLKQRNNRRLAAALTDYAYERHAAKRDINPMLWILVGPFITDRAFDLMTVRSIEEGSPSSLERRAIAYAFKQSDYAPVQRYLSENEMPVLLTGDGTPWQSWDNDN